MTIRLSSRSRRLSLGLLVLLAACSIFFATSLPTLADTVRVSDPVEVLNVQQIMSEGAKLGYPLDVYTTNTFYGTATDFAQRTIKVHLISKRLIVIAIDTVHHYLAIVGGTQVPLSNVQYTSAGQAFKNAATGNHFTSGTLAAIRSLEASLRESSSTSSSNGGAMLVILGVIVALVILGAIFGFIKRLLGFGGRSSGPRPPDRDQQVRYGDGQDNFGGGAVGDF